jgi:myo-inositol-1(or 4)-monophosphatase
LRAYRADGHGHPAYDPKTLLGVLLYAYATRVRSSRQIQRRCTEDLAFRVLAGNQLPDHVTIARFRARHQQALADLSAPTRRASSPKRGDRDPASEVDLAVERFVRDFLHNKTPEIEFLGEEEGGYPTGDGLLWLLDPIDGTVNFLHGLPLCAVSLSLCDANTVVVAVVDLPFIGSQYTALLGQGAYADGKRLRISQTSMLADALVSIDQFAFGDDAERKNRWRLRLTERLAHDAQRVRMLGASAIDLAWTAEGRLDACIMLGNKPWDTSAGVLIAREAGARVLDHDGSEHSHQSLCTIAVTPTLEAELMAAVQAALAE